MKDTHRLITLFTLKVCVRASTHCTHIDCKKYLNKWHNDWLVQISTTVSNQKGLLVVKIRIYSYRTNLAMDFFLVKYKKYLNKNEK